MYNKMLHLKQRLLSCVCECARVSQCHHVSFKEHELKRGQNDVILQSGLQGGFNREELHIYNIFIGGHVIMSLPDPEIWGGRKRDVWRSESFSACRKDNK